MESRLNTFRVKGFPFQFYNDPVYGVTIITAFNCKASEIKTFFEKHTKTKELDCDYEEWLQEDKVWAFTVRLFNLQKEFYTKNNLFHKALFFFFDYRNSKMTPQTISTIAHESLHGTISVFQNAGIELSEESEEAFTYYTGFLSEVISVSINKLIDKK